MINFEQIRMLLSLAGFDNFDVHYSNLTYTFTGTYCYSNKFHYEIRIEEFLCPKEFSNFFYLSLIKNNEPILNNIYGKETEIFKLLKNALQIVVDEIKRDRPKFKGKQIKGDIKGENN